MAFSTLVRLLEQEVVGAESLAFDTFGRLYAGDASGRLVRSGPDGSHPHTFADTGGRPLGLDFDLDGNLIVADALLGLLSVSPTGDITPLADEESGLKLGFTNDVAVGSDGRMFFTDSSSKHGPGNVLEEIMEHRPHGRLLVYDPESRSVHRLLDGLYFPNGVALNSDNSFVLVVETTAYRVSRYWLHGPRAGQSDIFIDNLPGFPDGISSDGRGGFWLAIYEPRNTLLDATMSWPSLRRILLPILRLLDVKPVRHGFVLGLDCDGRVLHNLQDPSGAYAPITSVVQYGDQLYLGSLTMNGIGKIAISGSTAPIDGTRGCLD